MARHANQEALTVTTAPKRRESLTTSLFNYDELRVSGTVLPNRYWILGPNGLWSSVARGSEAHKADRGGRARY